MSYSMVEDEGLGGRGTGRVATGSGKMMAQPRKARGRAEFHDC